MTIEKPALPDEIVALFEGSDHTTLVKFAGDHAVQAAIREMLAARTIRERELALAMAKLVTEGSLPTSDFAPGTHLMLELSAPKHPGVTRTITSRALDMGLHVIESDTCTDGFEPTSSNVEVGDAVHVCSKDVGPDGKLKPLLRVTARQGVWFIRQGTSRPLQVGARDYDKQSSIPLVLERLMVDDTQVIPPVSNADAYNSQAKP